MLEAEIEFFLRDAGRKIAILDSNLLLLWVTSRVGLPLDRFKRVKAFEVQDVLLLNLLISRFKAVATTAYVLAEASNLANELSGTSRNAWFDELAKFAVLTNEAHVSTRSLDPDMVIRFGITDAALKNLSTTHTLITAEYRLSSYLSDIGGSVINFNHLRPLWMRAK